MYQYKSGKLSQTSSCARGFFFGGWGGGGVSQTLAVTETFVIILGLF